MQTLTAEQVAAAEAAGCTFVAVPDHASHRYTMQRKVFRVGGRPMLATRGGGLYETAATLDRLILAGRRQLTQAAPAAVPAAETPSPAPPSPQASDPPAEAPPRTDPLRRAGRRGGADRAAKAPAPVAAPAATMEPELAEDEVAAAPGAAARRAARQPRWVTAGAERRGRASSHWTGKQR